MDSIRLLAQKEVEHTTKWWITNMKNTNSHDAIYSFARALIVLLYERIYEHWYPEDPSKGSGYRAIINDFHVDPILIRACKIANVDPNCLPGQVVQIVSPGMVRVRSLANESMEQIIYSEKPLFL